MATTNTISSTAAQPARPIGTGGLVQLIAKWARAYAAYLNRRAAIKALQELNDHQLRDIGISRCHIEGAVGGLDRPDPARF